MLFKYDNVTSIMKNKYFAKKYPSLTVSKIIIFKFEGWYSILTELQYKTLQNIYKTDLK